MIAPTLPAADVVRILPAWWSPKVWPLLLILAGAVALSGWAGFSEDLPAAEPVWPGLLVIAAAVAWRLRVPVAVLHPGWILFTALSEEDRSEYGIPWRRLRARPGSTSGSWTTLPASSIADWRREEFGIRITLKGEPARTVGLPLGGLREGDSARIVRWLTENVGG